MLSIEAIRKTLSSYFSHQPIQKAWIFGSYARGEQKSDSDLDILVDFDPDNYPSLLLHASIISDLEEILKTKIDLVPQEMVYPRVKRNIEQDKILIYERNCLHHLGEGIDANPLTLQLSHSSNLLTL